MSRSVSVASTPGAKGSLRKSVDRFLALGSEAALPILVLIILIALVLPIPVGMIDYLIAVNLAASLTILVVATQVSEAARFSSLPTLVLLTTLLRLGLNVATTRLILGEGRAGEIIATFGEFVVGGNFIVGTVVFLVLLVIQFIVISKGAERASDASARFFLDGMPFKQQAIEADLQTARSASDKKAEAEAKSRRFELSAEARLFGALEGAMKFIKGDAIAGIVIAAVNVIGGLVIGVSEGGLSIGQAARQYTLLTIGDGLVSQVPSLLISASAAALVTRVRATEDASSNAAFDIKRQIIDQPIAVMFVGIVLTMVALTSSVTGFPPVPFAALGAMAIGFSVHRFRTLRRQVATAEAPAGAVGKAAATTPRKPQSAPTPIKLVVPPELHLMLVGAFRDLTPDKIEFPETILQFYGPDIAGPELQVAVLWRDLREKLGFPVQRIGIEKRAFPQVAGRSSYVIELNGGVISRGSIRLDRSLAARIPDPAALLADAIAETAPLPGTWGEAAAYPIGGHPAGSFVRSPVQVLLDHLESALTLRAADLLDSEQAYGFLRRAAADFPEFGRALLDALASAQAAGVAEATEVLRMCLRDQIFLTEANRGRILEAFLRARFRREGANREARDAEKTYSIVRRELLPVMLSRYVGPTGALNAYRLEHTLLNRLGGGHNALVRDAIRAFIKPCNHLGTYIATSASPKDMPRHQHAAGMPVILVRDESMRRQIQTIISGQLPGVMVLDDEELAAVPEVKTWTSTIDLPEG